MSFESHFEQLLLATLLVKLLHTLWGKHHIHQESAYGAA